MKTNLERAYNIIFGEVYPHYISKAQRKSAKVEDIDTIICWLTGYDPAGLHEQIATGVTMERFFSQAPAINPLAKNMTGSICGYKVQEITDPIYQQMRWMDKLVDEVAKGKSLDKIIGKMEK